MTSAPYTPPPIKQVRGPTKPQIHPQTSSMISLLLIIFLSAVERSPVAAEADAALGAGR